MGYSAEGLAGFMTRFYTHAQVYLSGESRRTIWTASLRAGAVGVVTGGPLDRAIPLVPADRPGRMTNRA